MHDVLINKIATIKRCLKRVDEEYTDEMEFRGNFTKQDSVVLNIQRACEASIDIANFLINLHDFGIPQTARDSFDLLASANIITTHEAEQMGRMVGFRNIAVHDYQALNLDILAQIINKHLTDFDLFCTKVVVLETKISR